MSGVRRGRTRWNDAVVKGADHQRHDADRPLSFIEILQKNHFQLDRVLRQMGEQLVVKQAVAVMAHQAVDVVLVGRHDAQRRLESSCGSA